MTDVYRYTFQMHIDPIEIEAAILLSLLATESLHGETQTLLEVAHYFDSDSRSCVIEASSTLGRDFNRLFAGFVRSEFGETVFEVERVTQVSV